MLQNLACYSDLQQNFLENLKPEAYFRFTDLILAMTVHLPVWCSLCTRARFTVLVSCNDESLQFTHVRSFACRGSLRNWQPGFYRWSLLRNNNVTTNLQNIGSKYGKRRFAARLPVCLCNFWLFFNSFCFFYFWKFLVFFDQLNFLCRFGRFKVDIGRFLSTGRFLDTGSDRRQIFVGNSAREIIIICCCFKA